jgi:hypothetical protein
LTDIKPVIGLNQAAGQGVDNKNRLGFFLTMEEKEMKYAKFIIFVSVLTLIAAGVLAAAKPPSDAVTKESQAQWKVVIPQTLFAEKMRMAAFLDEKFGVMGGAGDPGKAHYTLDGGKTWTVADSSGG